jgi:hypothetical protein
MDLAGFLSISLIDSRDIYHVRKLVILLFFRSLTPSMAHCLLDSGFGILLAFSALAIRGFAPILRLSSLFTCLLISLST